MLIPYVRATYLSNTCCAWKTAAQVPLHVEGRKDTSATRFSMQNREALTGFDTKKAPTGPSGCFSGSICWSVTATLFSIRRCFDVEFTYQESLGAYIKNGVVIDIFTILSLYVCLIYSVICTLCQYILFTIIKCVVLF